MPSPNTDNLFSFKPTKTTKYMYNLNKLVYIFGLPYFWVEDLHLSEKLIRLIDHLGRYGNWAIVVMLLLEYSAFFTQNLTDKQTADLILFSVGQTIITGFRVQIAQREVPIRNVMYKLGVVLKKEYNDTEVEDQMIAKSKFFSAALTINCAMAVLMYTLEATLRVVRGGETFYTIITGWPNIEDRSVLSNIGRAMINIFWWIYLTRVCAVYSLVICLTIVVSHQFKNLSSYFCNLSNIFDNDQLTQREKEEEYEKALIVGIRIHSDTFKCADDIQAICRDVFSGQILFNIILLIVLMYQMVNSNHDLATTATVVLTALAILLSTGICMWNAGDITVEADMLPTAMYSSGWENCWHESSVRVRKLLVIAMMQAQQPVVLKGLCIIALSYPSYVSIVKSSYSVFSVLY